MSTLNVKQKRFADNYVLSGNAKESYLLAGYKAEGSSCEVNASRLLRNAKVADYIKWRNEQLDSKYIADLEEVKSFWTEIMRDKDTELKDRLKASEYIARTAGAFLDKREIKGQQISEIRFGFVDPTSGEIPEVN
jgi:phage terminase small subunit